MFVACVTVKISVIVLVYPCLVQRSCRAVTVCHNVLCTYNECLLSCNGRVWCSESRAIM